MDKNMVKNSQKSELSDKREIPVDSTLVYEETQKYDENVLRRGERISKPPTRYGFENIEYRVLRGINLATKDGVDNPAMQNRMKDGASGGIDLTSIEKTVLHPNRQPSYAKSIGSKANSKTSRRSSLREVEHLKKNLEREAEIFEIEMEKLNKKKEFLLRSQKLELELKEKEDILSNDGDCDDIEITGLDNKQRNKNVGEWVNNNESRYHCDEMNNPHIFESTRQHQFENPVQNDVLIAALKALQTKEIKDLPTFDGENILEWPNFLSEFRRSTAEYNITPSNNLRRLNKAITGNARQCIQTLLMSPDNIKEIISHLQMSFGRPEWILQHLISELRSLPIMMDGNIHEFKMFFNKLFGAITTIRNMKKEEYITNPELLGCLEEKLTKTTRHHWIRYKADLIRKRNNVDLCTLGEWFKYELDAQFAGLSAKDIINKSYTSDWGDNDNYIPDGKEFP